MSGFFMITGVTFLVFSLIAKVKAVSMARDGDIPEWKDSQLQRFSVLAQRKKAQEALHIGLLSLAAAGVTYFLPDILQMLAHALADD